MKKFPRKNGSRNFRENSQSNILRNFILVRFFVKIITRSNFPKKVIFFQENCHRTSQYKHEISEMNIRLLRRSACLRVQKNGDNQRSFVVEKYSSNNSVRTHILRRAEPGRRSAVPSGSLSRHSAGCLRLKDVRCRRK